MTETGTIDFLLAARRRLVTQWQEQLPLAELRAIAVEQRSEIVAPPRYLAAALSGTETIVIPEFCDDADLALLFGRRSTSDVEGRTLGSLPALCLLESPEEGLLRTSAPSQPLPRTRFGRQTFLLRNGFFQSEFDVLESAALGFDGMCVHAAGLDHFTLQYLTELCRDFTLSLVVWIESESTLTIALQTDAPYLGIQTFLAHGTEDEPARLTRLAPRLPSSAVRLAWTRNAIDPRLFSATAVRGVVTGIAP